MFSETLEETQSEDTAGWAGQPRQRGLIHTHTHTQKQAALRSQQRWRRRDGGGLRILNTNDLFQGGMCKEYTVLMWRGGNAVTSCSPA